MGRKKPIIGISSGLMVNYIEGELKGHKKCYLNKYYIDAIINSGGVPFIIPFSNNDIIIKEQVLTLDGLIISGGPDIFPYNYGQEPSSYLKDFFPERDQFEYKLLEESKKRKIPIMGMCRGIQIINTSENGTLYQDISFLGKKVLKHNQINFPKQKIHKVSIEKNSILFNILNKDEIMVNSFHHQVVDEVSDNYKIIAKASDGAIEAIEHKSYPFLLGLQWHPEMLFDECEDSKKILKRFIEEADKYKKTHSS